ncbi:MAG TPA: FtsX-like permease family protein [Thermodesulfobacteriota bacterium]
MIRLLPLMLRNALGNRRRSILTLLSLAVSIFLLATLVTLQEELERSVRASARSPRLVVRRATSLADPLPLSMRRTLERIPGVDLVLAMQWFGGVYVEERNFFANFAVDVDGMRKMWPEVTVDEAQFEAFRRERTAAMVGRRLVERFGWRLGQQVTLEGTVFPVDLTFTIRAVYRQGTDQAVDENAFWFHREYLEEALGRPGTIGTFWLRAANPAAIPRIMEEVDRTFRNTDSATRTETESAFALSFLRMVGDVRTMILSIASVVVFTILLVTANTTAMAVRERTREVAVMKALGFTRRHILWLLVGEAAAIAFGGGLLGAVGARLAYAAVDLAARSGGLLSQFAVGWDTVAAGALIAAAIGAVSAAVPAVRASRVSIARGLRHVG